MRRLRFTRTTCSAPRTDSQGFTLVELLLALAVFSFVLVFVTTAFVQLFRTYSRGITRKEVNQSSRTLMADITDKMRVVGEPTLVNTTNVSQGRLCVGSYSYVWNTVGQATNLIRVNGQQVNMVRINGDNAQSACNLPLQFEFTGVQATSMLGERVGMREVSITPTSGGLSGLYRVNLTASTTQATFLDTLLANCRTDSLSSAYCAQISLQETVGLRNR